MLGFQSILFARFIKNPYTWDPPERDPPARALPLRLSPKTEKKKEKLKHTHTVLPR